MEALNVAVSGTSQPPWAQAEQSVLQQIEQFIAATRQAVFVRTIDQLLMVRPDKTMSLNASATAILGGLYDPQGREAGQVLRQLVPQLGVEPARLLRDADELLQAVRAIVNEDFSARPMLRFGPYERQRVRYPTLAEIALTYKCQNRCRFCYASSPHREGEHRLMSREQVEQVMVKIFEQGHVPSLSFTGGEATLRPELPELIRFGKGLGFRINLISNAIKLADASYARRLVQAGLDSAQISLEAAQPRLHDHIVGRRGAFAQTVTGVRQLQQLGIHVHTNATLCAANLPVAGDLIRFLARELKLRTLSLNMVIRTGTAHLEQDMQVRYTQVAERLPDLLATARSEGIKLVWYSPIPYCIFNPVVHGLGAKSCACVDGILSVDPAGQVLPCSSFEGGLGSLLEHDFERIYRSRAARYWRKKQFIPPVCKSCPEVDICGGGCPLYWDAAGSFSELPRAGATDRRGRKRWEKQRNKGRSFGVPAPTRDVREAPVG